MKWVLKEADICAALLEWAEFQVMDVSSFDAVHASLNVEDGTVTAEVTVTIKNG